MSTVGLGAAPRFVRLLHRELDLDSFFDEVDRAVRDLIRFDSSCWLSLDPSTLLPTSHFTRELDSDHLMEIAENEFLEEDFNKFADLARATPPVGTLSHATERRPDPQPPTPEGARPSRLCRRRRDARGLPRRQHQPGDVSPCTGARVCSPPRRPASSRTWLNRSAMRSTGLCFSVR